MKKIAYLILILVLISCQKEDTDAIPTYIKIDRFTGKIIATVSTENLTRTFEGVCREKEKTF